MSEKEKDLGKEPKGIDPEKLFNEEEYITMKIGGEEENNKKSDPAKDLVALLASKTIGEKDIALDLLKKEKAVTLLVDAVKDCKNPKNKALLVAACWESGMDFRAHLDFFADLASDADLFVSMEAITVLSENIGEVDPKQAKHLIEVLIKPAKDHFNSQLIIDLIQRLKGML